MNINQIGGASAIDALATISGASTSQAPSAADGISTPASSSTVSKPGELLAKLNQLLQQDPAKFKEVTQQISDELKTAAQSASGPQAAFLSKLSDSFAQASSSGSLSALQPPGGGNRGGAVSGHHHHHGGGHHGGGAASGIEALFSTALDQVNQALSSETTAAAATSAA